MNAKDEFIEHVGGKEVICADLQTGMGCGPMQLHKEYSAEDYSRFLKSLDFKYDSGYGGQELFGTIWYSDGTWSVRGEYDGSEWWEHIVCPQIPSELTK